MPKRSDLGETTEVRLIKSEARSAIIQEREAILGGVKRMIDDLKSDLREHYPTKVDFLEWQLKTNKELDDLIRAHVAKDHKVHLAPQPRVSLIPRGRLTTKQKGAIIGALATLAGAIAAAIKYYLSAQALERVNAGVRAC
jgi:hypothetical protein